MGFEKICKKLNISDYRRIRWFFWILILNLLLIVVFFCNDNKVFYLNEINNFGNIYRFFWVLPFSFIGFSLLAFHVARKGLTSDTRPWLSYIFNYFPRLLAISLIIFSVLHLFGSTSGYLYYFLSAGLGLYLGYNIDWIKIEDFIKK